MCIYIYIERERGKTYNQIPIPMPTPMPRRGLRRGVLRPERRGRAPHPQDPRRQGRSEGANLRAGVFHASGVREYLSTGYGLQCSTEANGRTNVFHESPQETCFVTGLSGNPPNISLSLSLYIYIYMTGVTKPLYFIFVLRSYRYV